MGTSKLSQGQMVASTGGLVLIISLFLQWGGGQSAFQSFSDVDILMFFVGLAAIVFGLSPALGIPPRLPAGVLTGLGIAVTGWAAGIELEISGDVGVWLALLASIAIAWGAHDAAVHPATANALRLGEDPVT